MKKLIDKNQKLSERIRQTYSIKIEKKEKYGENMKEPKKEQRRKMNFKKKKSE